MKWLGVLFIVFSSSCYSVDWGGCKLTPYFYEGSIESTAAFFHGVNKLSIDFKKSENYWGVSLHKINKNSSNELLKNNDVLLSGISVEELVYKNYIRLLEQDLFHVIEKTEKFIIPIMPEVFGYSITAMLDPELFENPELRNLSIAVQEYEGFIVFIKIVVSSEGKLPPVSDVKEVVLQFINSCFIHDVKV